MSPNLPASPVIPLPVLTGPEGVPDTFRGPYSAAGSSRRLMLLMQYRWSVGTS